MASLFGFTVYANRWLMDALPKAIEFNVTSHDDYWIHYFNAKKNVVELNNNMTSIKSNADDLKNQINGIKNAIQSEDLTSAVSEVTEAIDSAIAAVQQNMTSIYTSVADRLSAAAETDSWFGDTAQNYANYINQSILKK